MTFEGLTVGAYKVKEQALYNWGLNSVSYEGANASQVNVDLPNRVVIIDLASGEQVTCTLTNLLTTYLQLIMRP